MEPNQLAGNGSHVKSYMKMFDGSVNPEDLLLLARADHLGRVSDTARRETLAAEYEEKQSTLREMLALYKERMSQPYVMGRDLVEAGLKPGPRFTEALAYAHKMRLAGLSKEEQLRQALGILHEGKNQSKTETTERS